MERKGCDRNFDEKVRSFWTISQIFFPEILVLASVEGRLTRPRDLSGKTSDLPVTFGLAAP